MPSYRRKNSHAISQCATNTNTLENSRDIEVDHDDENRHVGTVIRYIFAVNRSKTAIHGDKIKKNCLSGVTPNYSSIMTKVKKKLSEIFGYQLIELGGLKYILVNKINNPYIKSSSPEETAERILLCLTLTYLFMACESDATHVKENDLWQFFEELNIIKEGNFEHKYFGNVKKLITVKFIEQLYLTRNKINNTEEIGYVWGPRANAEVTRRALLEFVSKIYGGRPINTWPAQLELIEKLENLSSS